MEQTAQGSLAGWRIAQWLVWLIGFTIFFCLVFYPETGILLFWNILIPAAPLLLVVFTGLWRNVCPMASIALLPRHMGWSSRKIMPARFQAIAGFIAVLILYIIVPLRHAVFNVNGQATAILLAVFCTAGLVLGFVYEWKSAWCSGFCPIHPVEKLYGSNVVMRIRNAHCDNCMHCVSPCPDSTPNMHPRLHKKFTLTRLSGLLITGGLPGFIWGWFHVPDEHQLQTASQIWSVYLWPFAGLAVTMSIYLFLLDVLKLQEQKLVRIFAAAAVSCYYWYRIPGLLGYSVFAQDGMLVNLTPYLSYLVVQGISAAMVVFFFYWLVLRKPNKKSWILRPVVLNH